MTRHASSGKKARPLLPGMAIKDNRGDQFAIRVASILIPTSATAHLVAFWLPKALAWGLSIFGWLLVAYWIPPLPQMRFGRWLILALSLSILGLLFAKFQPDMF